MDSIQSLLIKRIICAYVHLFQILQFGDRDDDLSVKSKAFSL